jgi:hypothetical protein
LVSLISLVVSGMKTIAKAHNNDLAFNTNLQQSVI